MSKLIPKNDIFILNINNIELSDLSEQDMNSLNTYIIDNVNIKQLEEKIHEIILKLSSVGAPCFGADAVYIALDNQKRLELVHQLLYNLDDFKFWYKHLKRNKITYFKDSEKVYGFLYRTKELVNIIFDYGEYNEYDKKEQIRQLEEFEKKMALLAELDRLEDERIRKLNENNKNE